MRREAEKAQILISRAYKSIKYKNLRKISAFKATLYLEVDHRTQHELLISGSKVEVFGEFTGNKPWMTKVPCKYDNHFKCFKADVEIRLGQSFKFIIDGGSFVCSKRYCKVRDLYKNENNIYDPRKIIWTQEKRKICSTQSSFYQQTEDIISVTETNSESYNEADFKPMSRANQ